MRISFRTALVAVLPCLLLATAARADDTKPPTITDVKASVKGGQVLIEARITDETGVLSAICHHRKGSKSEDSQMVKNDYDDVFKVSFAGDGSTEYWIEATDLLGNGPSAYGTSSKTFTASGKKPVAVASNDKPPPRENAAPHEKEKPPPEEKAPPPEKHHSNPPSHTASAASKKPIIEHRQPSQALPDGQEATLRMKIHGDTAVAFAGMYTRPKGTSGFKDRVTVTKTEGDSYEAKIPAAQAHGTLEYLLAAKDTAGNQTDQGDGPPGTQTTWYSVTFKSAGGGFQAATSSMPDQNFSFTHLALYRVPPGNPITVRAQILPIKTANVIKGHKPESGVDPAVPDEAEPEKVVVLWRDNDGNDQATDMVLEKSGGLGGYKADLPPQNEGAIYYQIVACDGSFKCAVDTGGKKKWHGVAVAAAAGGALPLPLEHPSTKAPGPLPE